MIMRVSLLKGERIPIRNNPSLLIIDTTSSF
jgi:hypothetical protein